MWQNDNEDTSCPNGSIKRYTIHETAGFVSYAIQAVNAIVASDNYSWNCWRRGGA